MPSSRASLRLALPALSLALLAACDGDGTDPDCDLATALTLTVGVQVTDAIDTTHCISGGDPGDLFTLNVSQTSAVRFTATSGAFPPEITIAKPGSPPSADDEMLFRAGSPARAVAILTPGQYVVDIQSSNNSVGAYTLNSEVVTLNACHHNSTSQIYILPGTTLNSEITTTDCAAPVGTVGWFEIYTVRLRAGRSYTFTATTAINQFNLRLGTGTATLAGDGVITTDGSESITFTPTSTGYYLINFAPIGNRTGAYTLTVSP